MEYSTKQIADAAGIHVNTVRFYERMGILTAPRRRSNGYRVYGELQLDQCRLIRCAMRAEVLQNGLRKQAVCIVRRCAQTDFDAALAQAAEYRFMIEREIGNAQNAIACVENSLGSAVTGPALLKRQDAAKALGVTSETLRTWERSGLINIKRIRNGYRVYSSGDMNRLNIIRTLRCANYSLTSILRLLNKLDAGGVDCVESALNTPSHNEDIVSVCDRLIVSLRSTAADAKELEIMLRRMKEKYATLQ